MASLTIYEPIVGREGCVAASAPLRRSIAVPRSIPAPCGKKVGDGDEPDPTSNAEKTRSGMAPEERDSNIVGDGDGTRETVLAAVSSIPLTPL